MFLKLLAITMAVVQLIAVGATPAFDKRVTHTGSGTFYNPDEIPGPTACGKHHSDSELVVALSQAEFDSGSFCGRKITATYQGKSVTAEVVDFCVGQCGGQFGLHFSEAAYKKLASLDKGIIFGVEWHFLAQS